VFDGLKKLFGFGGVNGVEMISCDEVRARLFEYLDEELDEALAEEVRRHLDACPQCYPRAAFERNFLDAVRRTEEGGVVGADLKNRILEALAAEGAEE
jgi:anti-sigma factor (TIGR02949 family)